MNFFRKIKHELNYLKWEDIGQIFVFVISLIPALCYKAYIYFTKRKIWLICEDRNGANDNGFCFFTYLNKYQPQIESFYAIDYSSVAFERVSKIGKTVKYGSFMHWILYFACEYNISTQKSGKPNGAICYVLEVFGIIKSKFVFLQHGITLSKADWLFYNNTKMRLFICGAKPEYDYIRDNFGYPEENLAFLGFCRFDEYHTIRPNKKQIVLMPSWREWIASKNEYSSIYEDTSDFTKTEYYQKYQSLINNPELANFLEKNNLTMFFYPHRNMQKYIHYFSAASSRIQIVTNENSSIRALLMDSAVMITDYSSVALDFAYMKKPVIYYQFDEKRFREAQYAEGYFSYRNSGLGVVCEEEKQVVAELEQIYLSDLCMSERFEQAHSAFFPLCDDRNNERTYKAISQL